MTESSVWFATGTGKIKEVSQWRRREQQEQGALLSQGLQCGVVWKGESYKDVWEEGRWTSLWKLQDKLALAPHGLALCAGGPL